MKFNCPILTSNLDFAEYVCSDAACYFDPWEPQSIKKSILKLKNDCNLSCKLAAKGKQRLNQLTSGWDDIAQSLATDLDRIIKPELIKNKAAALFANY
jgi:hypothetical protein